MITFGQLHAFAGPTYGHEQREAVELVGGELVSDSLLFADLQHGCAGGVPQPGRLRLTAGRRRDAGQPRTQRRGTQDQRSGLLRAGGGTPVSR